MYLYIEAANIFLLIHTVTSISVASTPSYNSAQGDSSYAAPSTIEPTIDYKSNNIHSHFPYARQFFEPLSPLTNPYAENLPSFNQLTAKPIFNQRQFYPSAPFTSTPYTDPQATPYHLHGYLPQQPYSTVNDYPSQFYDQQYQLPFPQKFGKSPLAPDCDFHPLTFRNTRPFLFRPFRSDNYLEPSLGKPNPFYRFQHSLLGANLANNVYH